MNNKIDCSIILDLLPLYHDNVVSEETKTAIEKHLSECKSCQKEYEVLSMDIQEPSKLNTKEKFTDMIKKQKRKQITNVIISVILLCSLFVGGFHFLTHVPLRKVPAEQIEVLKTFKVETTHGDKFVVLYNIVSYNNRLITDIDFNKNTNSIELNIKVPILSHAIPTIYNGTDYAKVEDIRVIDAQDNAETLYCADKVIWTKNENGNDEVPKYAYEYVNNTANSWVYDFKKGFIGANYDKGKDAIYWDLEGNVIDKETVIFD